MHKEGTIIRWHADRAFGFIRSPGASRNVFFHLRDYQGVTEPREGLLVVFVEVPGGEKGPRASAVAPAATASPGTSRTVQPAATASATPRNAPPENRRATTTSPRARGDQSADGRQQGRAMPSAPTMALMVGWLTLWGWGAMSAQFPLWALGAVAVLNVATYAAYAVDKHAARNGQWRTQESHLHLLSLLGGWPAAWFAQQWLRHKSRKVAFRGVYWATVAVHCAAVAGWLLRHRVS